METRKLTLKFNDDGVPSTVKSKPSIAPEKLRLRSTHGVKILECLKRGAKELHLSDPNVKFTLKRLESISNRICDSCYDTFKHSRRAFKQKIFDIYTNLKRSNNHDLRRKILTRAMSITELIHTDTIQLAPDQVQKARMEELEKHYIRNVILYSQDKSPNSGNDRKVEEDANLELLNSVSIDTDGSSFNGDFTDEENEGITEESEPSSEYTESSEPEEPTSVDLTQSNGDKIELPTQEEKETVEATDKEQVKQTPISRENTLESVSQLHTPHSSTDSKLSSTLSMLSSLGAKRLRTDDKPKIIPPDSTHLKLQAVKDKIEKRINKLPAHIAKPFISAYNNGDKRINLLIQRYVTAVAEWSGMATHWDTAVRKPIR